MFGVAPGYEHHDLIASLGHLDAVFDIGANVGQFALLITALHPNAKVYSFEPLNGPANTFEKVMATKDNVELFRVALGNREGEDTIYVSARNDSSSLLQPKLQSQYFPGTHEVAIETIIVKRLDQQFLAMKSFGTTLLKIDVQGFEGEVLRGGENVLPHFDWIYAEMSFVELYKGQDLAHILIDWLMDRQFDLYSVLVDPNAIKDGRPVQADFLFRNRLRK